MERRAPLYTMFSVSLTPGSQVVPGAVGVRGDQVPAAQRWNWVPPTQLYWPAFSQGLQGACATSDPVPSVAVATDVSTVLDGIITVAIVVVGRGTKTPPGLDHVSSVSDQQLEGHIHSRACLGRGCGIRACLGRGCGIRARAIIRG